MGIPECDIWCYEIHDGDDREIIKGKNFLLWAEAMLAEDGIQLRPDDAPGMVSVDADTKTRVVHRCPRSGYVLTRWDKIRDWLLGYR